MKRFVIAVFSIVLVSGCVSTPIQPAAKSFSAQGWGATNCQGMMDDLASADTSSIQSLNKHMYEAWLSGFISGVNYADAALYDVAGDMGPEQVLILLKAYCIEHPETDVPLAMKALFQDWIESGKSVRESP